MVCLSTLLRERGIRQGGVPALHVTAKMVEPTGISPAPSGLQASALLAPVRAAINPHRRAELQFGKVVGMVRVALTASPFRAEPSTVDNTHR